MNTGSTLSAALLEPPPSRPAANGVAANVVPRSELSSRRVSPPWRFLFVTVALAAIGGLAWYAGLIDPQKLRERLPWRAETKPVALTLYGNVDVRQVNLAFKVEGRIASVNVDEGDAVEAGAVVATLEPRYFDDELRLAHAQRDAQAATLARLVHGSRPEEIAQARALAAEREATAARADLYVRRLENLVSRNSVTRQECDDAEAAARVARAQLDSAREGLGLAEIGPRQEDIAAARAQLAAQEAEVTRSERRHEDSRLVAPGRGIILTRAREVGAIVQPGEIVFTLTLSNPVWVRTYISEPELGKVHPGAEVDVVTDSDRGRPYRGRVGFISPTAEFTPKTVETEELRTRLVYRVRIVVDDPDNGLRQGMPVTVRMPPPSAGRS